jgi:hypothetical protein
MTKSIKHRADKIAAALIRAIETEAGGALEHLLDSVDLSYSVPESADLYLPKYADDVRGATELDVAIRNIVELWIEETAIVEMRAEIMKCGDMYEIEDSLSRANHLAARISRPVAYVLGGSLVVPTFAAA